MKKNNNVFMIALAAVTVVVVGVLMWLGYSRNQAITEELMAQRQGVTGKLKNLSRKPYVNQSTNMTNEKRVEMLLDNLSQVRSLNYEFNSRNFSVPMLDITGATPRPALPYDARVWGSRELAARYVDAYRRIMADLLARLNPTTPPDDAEVNMAAKQQAEMLENMARIEGKSAESARRPAGLMNEYGVGMTNPNSMAGVSQDVATLAKEYALNNAILMKSQGGYVYADNGSLFPMFIFGKIYSLADLPPEDLWLAQKSIWIQTDIINAIAEAVKDVFDARKLPDSERNVLNSPIKQLTAINIEKLKSAGSGRGGAMYPGMAEPGYGGTAGGEAVKSDTLTTYGANALFDVANYSFTVVMPTRYLPVLEKKLLKQNYHVILSEEILPVDSAGGSAAVGEGMMAGFGMSGGASSVKAVNGLYNFGTEPVCRITITAQLLLVTSFTRGQWDSAHNMWVSYPLMPVEVMKNMPQTALRPEDRDFIEQFERLGRGEQPVEGRPAIPWYRNDAWRPAKSSEKDARTPGKVQ